MWLFNDTVRPGSSKIVTRQRFTGPFMIKNVVKSRDDIETAYQLINKKTGKVVRNLVTHDLLKACDIDRESFSQRLPSMEQAEGNTPQKQAVEPKADKSVEEPRPLQIIKIKSTGGRKQYLVRYSDSKDYGVVGCRNYFWTIISVSR